MVDEPIDKGGESVDKGLEKEPTDSKPETIPSLPEEIAVLRKEGKPNWKIAKELCLKYGRGFPIHPMQELLELSPAVAGSIKGTLGRGQDWLPSNPYFLEHDFPIDYNSRTFVTPSPAPLEPLVVKPEVIPPKPQDKPGGKNGEGDGKGGETVVQGAKDNGDNKEKPLDINNMTKEDLLRMVVNGQAMLQDAMKRLQEGGDGGRRPELVELVPQDLAAYSEFPAELKTQNIAFHPIIQMYYNRAKQIFKDNPAFQKMDPNTFIIWCVLDVFNTRGIKLIWVKG